MKPIVRRAYAHAVIDGYGRHNVHPTKGLKVVFGFNYAPLASPEDAGHVAYDYWFSRKKDAVRVADWIDRTGWDGEGCLDMSVRRSLVEEYIAGGYVGEFQEIGKLYF